MKFGSGMLVLVSLLLALAGCGHPDSFRVQGELDDGATINLRVIFHTDRGVVTGITSSNDGKFAFEGSSPVDVPVEIYDNEYRLQARFPARNGADIDLKINRANRFANEAKGYPLAAEYTNFLSSRADELHDALPHDRNRIYAQYIGEHPDADLSLQLLWGEFDVSQGATLADSLSELLSERLRSHPGARRFFENVRLLPSDRADSIVYRVRGGRHEMFKATDGPALLVFSDSRTSDHRQLSDSLHRLVKLIKSRDVGIYDLNCDADTSAWRRATVLDSATWTQGWLEAGPASPGVDRLRLPMLPYYILVDSAGRTVLRTRSQQEAIDSILSKF